MVEFLQELYRSSVWYLIFLLVWSYFSLLMLTFQTLRIRPLPASIDQFVAEMPVLYRLWLNFIAQRSPTVAGYLKRTLEQPPFPAILLVIVGLICFGGLIFVMMRQMLVGTILVETLPQKLAYIFWLLLAAFQVGQTLRFGSKLRRIKALERLSAIR